MSLNSNQTYKNAKMDYAVLKSTVDESLSKGSFDRMMGGGQPYESILCINTITDTMKLIRFPDGRPTSVRRDAPQQVVTEFNALTDKSIYGIGGNVTAETDITVAQSGNGLDLPQITRFVEYSIRNDTNRAIVLTAIVAPDREIVMGSMTIINNVPTQKRFHFYTRYDVETVAVVGNKTTFLGDDVNFVLGICAIKIVMNATMATSITLNVTGVALNAVAKVNSIEIQGDETVNIVLDNVQLDDTRKIKTLFRDLQESRQRAKSSYKTCVNMDLLNIKNRPLHMQDSAIKAKVFQSVGQTICNNISYNYKPDIVAQIMKTEIVLKLIIMNSLKDIEPNLAVWDDATYDAYMMDIPKVLPSTIENKNILFKNGTGDFVKLNPRLRVIFDSGNSAATSIGRRVVEALGLPVHTGCMMISTGVGGQNKTSGDYVKLTFKFDKSYANSVNKEYSILAFIDDANLRDIVLFGHSNGLDLLFDDNFSIKGEYSKNDPRTNERGQRSAIIINEHVRLNKILDTYLESPDAPLNISILLELIGININNIHGYQTGIDEEKFSGTFVKLRDVKRRIRLNDKMEKPLQEKILLLIDRILNNMS
ncbi:hypothetical protein YASMINEVIRUS_58 [Yasminevirus sp. GU-2018]|uniref:Uncharacterized protein n=1 Tax=Yasminevirus sp. GU-2018 TaxID=2420051 RepID=A0A5K0U712_9VIRU|nr:hypothetical protein YASMINEVIRUS_58 [Yasminevirus sp. GU-2018]